MEDLEIFRYIDDESTEVENSLTQDRRRKPRPAFIRGPISLAWLARANRIPRSNALRVGLMLHYLAGLRSSRKELVLTVKQCKVIDLERKSVQRGLKDLENAQLVRIDRSRGRAPRVEILEIEN
jgi:hypothetical protein